MSSADAAARFVPVSSAFFVLDWPPAPAEFSTARQRPGLVMVDDDPLAPSTNQSPDRRPRMEGHPADQPSGSIPTGHIPAG